MKKVAVLIPVRNEAELLPGLCKALGRLRANSLKLRFVFVDNDSSDDSLAIIRKFAAGRKDVTVLSETERGFAHPLNRGRKEIRGDEDFVLFLDADALPTPTWATEMAKALETSDLVVGETKSTVAGKVSAYGRVAQALFRDHSKRAAHAEGHALPWGPTCNLGVRRELLERVGPFSVEAAGAFDIDWCWRAIFLGARIAYAPKASVSHFRRNEREALLRQFERYGLGEAWLHHTYSFLLEASDREPDPLLASVEAYARMRRTAKAGQSAAYTTALEEVAAAFASGVRAGYERPHRACGQKRELRAPLSWPSGKTEVTVLVPGKGVTQLSGKMLSAWEALRGGMDEHELGHLFERLFKLSHDEAAHEAHEFRKALSL